MKNPEQRIGVFVDVSNMYYSAKNLYGAKVNFGAVLKAAVAGRKLIRAIAYVIRAEEIREQAFFDALRKEGFEVRTKDLQVFWGGVKKGDWDVGMTIDMIKLANKLDVIVLVTGDGDFLPLLNYLKENKGCLVEIISFGKTTSSKLVEAADDYLDLDLNPQKFLIKSIKKAPRRYGD